jgi:hypothetical protein
MSAPLPSCAQADEDVPQAYRSFLTNAVSPHFRPTWNNYGSTDFDSIDGYYKPHGAGSTCEGTSIPVNTKVKNAGKWVAGVGANTAAGSEYLGCDSGTRVSHRTSYPKRAGFSRDSQLGVSDWRRGRPWPDQCRREEWILHVPGHALEGCTRDGDLVVRHELRGHDRWDRPRPEQALMPTPHSTGRSSSGIGRTAALLVVALPMLAACSGNAPGTEPDDRQATGGPVAFVDDPHFVQTANVEAIAGQKVVFGATTVRNHGTKPATLTAGTLDGKPVGDGRARVSSVRVVDVTSGGDLVGAAVWPFEDYRERSVPLEGYTLKSGAEAELLFVVDVAKTGQWYWPKTSVHYDSGAVSYQDETQFGFMVCPRGADTCEPPKPAP